MSIHNIKAKKAMLRISNHLRSGSILRSDLAPEPYNGRIWIPIFGTGCLSLELDPYLWKWILIFGTGSLYLELDP